MCHLREPAARRAAGGQARSGPLPELPVPQRGRSLIAEPAGSLSATVVRLETPVGIAEAEIADVRGAKALLVFGHGAGGGLDSADLAALAAAGRAAGCTTVGVRQPYRVAGRRVPAPASHLDTAWVSVLGQLRSASGPLPGRRRSLPLIVAGRSSGARVACRTAADVGAAAVLCLAFPLHPPGRPERTRAAELASRPPTLVVQGSRDPFGTPSEFPTGTRILQLDGADHRLVAAGLSDALAAAVRSAMAAAGIGVCPAAL